MINLEKDELGTLDIEEKGTQLFYKRHLEQLFFMFVLVFFGALISLMIFSLNEKRDFKTIDPTVILSEAPMKLVEPLSAQELRFKNLEEALKKQTERVYKVDETNRLQMLKNFELFKIKNEQVYKSDNLYEGLNDSKYDENIESIGKIVNERSDKDALQRKVTSDKSSYDDILRQKIDDKYQQLGIGLNNIIQKASTKQENETEDEVIAHIQDLKSQLKYEKQKLVNIYQKDIN